MDLNHEDAANPYAPAPGPLDPARGKEVFAPVDAPFEAPVKEIESGPLYVEIEERVPEVAARSGDDGAEGKAEKSGFPVDRRNFMKLFSASSLAAATACIRRPVEKAIPYVNQPVDQVPGVSVYYATTCGQCTSGCGIMVRTREGRPAKLEGLPDHPISNGKLCALGQAALQGLYHPERLTSPQVRIGATPDPISWETVHEYLARKLNGKTKIGILTCGSTGNLHDFYREVLTRLGSSPNRLYTYESNGLIEAIVQAHKLAFNVEAMPRLDLSQTRLIVGVGSDFLDNGTSSVYHAKSFSDAHAFRKGTAGRFVQFEASLTNTGAAADERHVIPPGTETLALLLLVRALLENPAAKGTGASRARIKALLDKNSSLIAAGYDRVGVPRETFDALANDLLSTPSVVLAGGTDVGEDATSLQLAAIMANELIGAYESSLRLARGWMVPPVKPGDLKRFFAEAGDLEALIIINTNPAFTIPQSWGFKELVDKIPFVVSAQPFPTETCELADLVLPTHHYLESWGDEQPVAGFWSARQPVVRPVTGSRQAEDVLLWTLAALGKPLPYREYRDYMKKRWQAVHKVIGAQSDFETFFKAVLHRGFVGKIESQAVSGLGDVASHFRYGGAGATGLKLMAPFDSRLKDGRGAHLPVLQEIGDSLTTIAWDTWVALHPETAKSLGVKRNDVVKISGPGGSFEVAVFPMPGMHRDAVVVHRGNGHWTKGVIEGGNGVDPLAAFSKAEDPLTGSPVTSGQAVKIEPTGKRYLLAAMQKHNDLGNRTDIVKTVSLADATKHVNDTKDLYTAPNIYPELPREEYRWGMSIDLDKCTGCGACMAACAIENNVPQVGREDILKGREMHWIRLDRYFAGPVDNPTVTFQPMLCQQCNHAPCEAVCPVFATTHDPEGINAMTYNRCVGTRYCANACPYKVRRFNWWTHEWGTMGKRPQDRNPRALNPDVTVRTKGVMEKCNFCYQRIREAKHRAKLAGRQIMDGEIQVACEQTCPSDAIVFGNVNDPGSRIARLKRDYRAYMALNGDPEHGHYGLKTWPSVSYLAAVRQEETGSHHG